MNLWSRRLFRRGQRHESRPAPATEPAPSYAPLPVIVHSHPRDAVPPGPLEEGFVEIVDGDLVLHGLAGFLRPDGSVADLPATHVEWARQLSYRHLKREGCLAEYGIPIIPAYEYVALVEYAATAPRPD